MSAIDEVSFDAELTFHGQHINYIDMKTAPISTSIALPNQTKIAEAMAKAHNLYINVYEFTTRTLVKEIKP